MKIASFVHAPGLGQKIDKFDAISMPSNLCALARSKAYFRDSFIVYKWAIAVQYHSSFALTTDVEMKKFHSSLELSRHVL